MSKVIIAVPCINGNVYIKFVATSDILKLTHDPDVIPLGSTIPCYNIKTLLNFFIGNNAPLITSQTFFQQNNAEKYVYEPIVANSMDNALNVIGTLYAKEGVGTIVYDEIVPFDIEQLRNMFQELNTQYAKSIQSTC